MMLSEILNRYFVLPLNQSEIVGFFTEDHPEHGEIIVITWTDSYTLDSFCQEFVDQEVDTDLGNTFHYKGQFNVTPIGDGGPVAFIALDAVPLPQQQADCQCIDCGGDRPDHDSTCSYMHELYGEQPTVVDGEVGAFDTDFMRHIASVCRATYDLCQPKPQRTSEDVREHYGELCLSEMVSIADEIERRLAASSGKAGEAAGWVRGDTFVDAKFWTSDTPPQGWTPVYRAAPQPAAVDEATRLLRAYRGAPKFSNDHNAIKQTCALEDEIDLFLATQQGGES